MASGNLAPHRKRPLGFLLLLLLLSVDAQAQVMLGGLEQREDLYYAPNATIPFTGPVTDAERRIGGWMWRGTAGQVEHVEEYESGQHVYAAGWHPNGQQATEMYYRQGRPHGVRRTWDARGQVREERGCEDGQLHGPLRVWDHKGHLLHTATYGAGQLDGEVSWWYTNGQKRWESHYAAGQRTGIWK